MRPFVFVATRNGLTLFLGVGVRGTGCWKALIQRWTLLKPH